MPWSLTIFWRSAWTNTYQWNDKSIIMIISYENFVLVYRNWLWIDKWANPRVNNAHMLVAVRGCSPLGISVELYCTYEFKSNFIADLSYSIAKCSCKGWPQLPSDNTILNLLFSTLQHHLRLPRSKKFCCLFVSEKDAAQCCEVMNSWNKLIRATNCVVHDMDNNYIDRSNWILV